MVQTTIFLEPTMAHIDPVWFGDYALAFQPTRWLGSALSHHLLAVSFFDNSKLPPPHAIVLNKLSSENTYCQPIVLEGPIVFRNSYCSMPLRQILKSSAFLRHFSSFHPQTQTHSDTKLLKYNLASSNDNIEEFQTLLTSKLLALLLPHINLNLNNQGTMSFPDTNKNFDDKDPSKPVNNKNKKFNKNNSKNNNNKKKFNKNKKFNNKNKSTNSQQVPRNERPRPTLSAEQAEAGAVWSNWGAGEASHMASFKEMDRYKQIQIEIEQAAEAANKDGSAEYRPKPCKFIQTGTPKTNNDAAAAAAEKPKVAVIPPHLRARLTTT